MYKTISNKYKTTDWLVSGNNFLYIKTSYYWNVIKSMYILFQQCEVFSSCVITLSFLEGRVKVKRSIVKKSA